MAEHRVPLGTSRWSLWREVGLRSAGFPARRVEAVCDDDLAAAADGVDGPGANGRSDAAYQAAFMAATARLSAALVEIANEPRFREALAWQNPRLLTQGLKSVASHRVPADRPDRARNWRVRRDELAIASYLQRYCLKNETIGFFGPVGWARISPTDAGLAMTPGPELLTRRRTYFEVWTIDELADAIAALPGMLAWLMPRATNPLTVMPPERRPVLSAVEQELLLRCDGTRTVAELVDADAAKVDALQRLFKLRAVDIGLRGPVGARPEQELADRLERIGERDLRERGLALLAELTAGRDAVAAAAGDADKVLAASASLDETFERITGSPATRRDGGTYAGRTLLYEDCVRDVDVRVGLGLLNALHGPLSLVLDSVQWLVGSFANRFQERLVQLFDEEAAAANGDPVPLMRMFARAGPELAGDMAAATVAEFQERWRDVLNVPLGIRRYEVETQALAERAARLFPRVRARWSNATRCSVDIMIAASGAEAVNSGDYQLVLAQVHAATNALDSRALVEQHEDPARLVSYEEADHGDRYVYAIPPTYVNVSSRVSPPRSLLSPRCTYISLGTDSVVPPPDARTLKADDLVVDRRGDRLVVTNAGDGDELELFEVIAPILSATVQRLFRPTAPARHTPRITIDRLVFGRESWTFRATRIPWANVKDESRRYAEARRWRRKHRLPERVFVRIPTEIKPIAVDFRSLVLVNLLGKMIRTAAAEPSAAISVSEMLPDVEDLWLTDADGERYTCELRFVAVGNG